MRKPTFVILTLALVLFFSALPAPAFDTGLHASITIDSLSWAGFNRNAANAVQVSNWLTDYYTNSPTNNWLTSLSGSKCDLAKLHFDNLFTLDDIRRYWATLGANTKEAVRQAEKNDDVVEFYTVLGMSLHAVQDFYSHSNWDELLGTNNDYNTLTWLQAKNPPSELRTGWYDSDCLDIPQGSHKPHGGYKSGLNHDSVVRPNYDRAYVYALAASYEWTENVLSWISPGFAIRVKNYNPETSDACALAKDQQASIYISEWVSEGKVPNRESELDGHWNGPRSGYFPAFAAFSYEWAKSSDSIYVESFKNNKIYAALSKNLYTSTSGQRPPYKTYPTTGTVFEMRALSVYANVVNVVNVQSYYGTLVATNIGNSSYEYRDASQLHRPRTEVPWRQLILVPSSQSSIDFIYTLWDEWITTNNDPVPIQDSKTTLTFTCKVGNASCTGDISGGPWSSSSPYKTRGDGSSGAEVEFYFTTTPAKNMSSQERTSVNLR